MTQPISWNPLNWMTAPTTKPARPEGQAAAPTSDRPAAPAMARDGFVRSAAPYRDQSVSISIRQLDERRGKLADDARALDMRASTGVAAPDGRGYAQRKAELATTDSLLAAIRKDAEKVAATPDADGKAVDRFKTLMLMAEQTPLQPDQALKIGIEAHDIARNLGRDFPSDPSITATQLQLANRIGQIADQRANLLAAAKSRSLTGDDLAAAPGKVAALDRQESLIRAMIAHADRVADRPLPASGRDVDTLKALMTKACEPNLSAADTLKMLDEVEHLGL